MKYSMRKFIVFITLFFIVVCFYIDKYCEFYQDNCAEDSCSYEVASEYLRRTNASMWPHDWSLASYVMPVKHLNLINLYYVFNRLFGQSAGSGPGPFICEPPSGNKVMGADGTDPIAQLFLPAIDKMRNLFNAAHVGACPLEKSNVGVCPLEKDIVYEPEDTSENTNKKTSGNITDSFNQLFGK